MIQILFGPLGFRYRDITFGILNTSYRGINSLGGNLIVEESTHSLYIGPRSGNTHNFQTYTLSAPILLLSQDLRLEQMRRLI